ncbi:hypothetical protein CTAYLR_007548 [Chrysophaeum taylorii]|uniref:Uncharacterized protein n=1 Tax=Chrysophaeum taylorii TaxID=2483200 RepID=A0AAD7XH93_9STRA|nr:hypothetical protein CTAYLR_007548 [Chrysophaeum taylorii]
MIILTVGSSRALVVTTRPRLKRRRCTQFAAAKGGSTRWRALRWYDDCLARAPIRTKMASSGLVSAVGDGLAQLISSTPPDLKRTAAWTLCGALYFAPFLHFWYNMLARLERHVQERYGASKTVTVLGQLVLNQTVGAATINFFFCFVFQFVFLALDFDHTLAPGVAVARAVDTVRRTFLSIMLANWLVWPLPSLVNLVFVPLQYRVLFNNGVALVWKCILSLITARHHHHHHVGISSPSSS